MRPGRGQRTTPGELVPPARHLPLPLQLLRLHQHCSHSAPISQEPHFCELGPPGPLFPTHRGPADGTEGEPSPGICLSLGLWQRGLGAQPGAPAGAPGDPAAGGMQQQGLRSGTARISAAPSSPPSCLVTPTCWLRAGGSPGRTVLAPAPRHLAQAWQPWLPRTLGPASDHRGLTGSPAPHRRFSSLSNQEQVWQKLRPPPAAHKVGRPSWRLRPVQRTPPHVPSLEPFGSRQSCHDWHLLPRTCLLLPGFLGGV